MTIQNTPLVHVALINGNKKFAIGRLAQKERKIFFEYTPEFLKSGLEISPFKLPLRPGVFESESAIFDGLFGVFNDSLPDGWGRLLLDRKLMKAGFNPNSLSPLDRLCYVGHNTMGALIYEPEIEKTSDPHLTNLDDIANEMTLFQENENDHFIDELLYLNGSSAGARPKVMMNIAHENWIIKFRSSFDPKDIGAIEYAYHLMAVAAKLDVPQAKLFPSKKGYGYFGVKRFDNVDGKRIHMHSISGLLDVSHRELNLDYETIMKATHWLTKDVRECEKQFRAAVFNVLSHNRDDHAKNFSFLMNEQGIWRVSPAYDLTFSSGPNGEHCSTVMGEGKYPRMIHLLKLAEVGSIKKQRALEIIEEVSIAVSNWANFAAQAGVRSTFISSALKEVQKHLYS